MLKWLSTLVLFLAMLPASATEPAHRVFIAGGHRMGRGVHGRGGSVGTRGGRYPSRGNALIPADGLCREA